MYPPGGFEGRVGDGGEGFGGLQVEKHVRYQGGGPANEGGRLPATSQCG